MNNINSVKIGGLTYQIIMLEDVDFESSLTNLSVSKEEAKNVDSYINYNHLIICVRSNLHISQIKQHLLHEIIHGLIDDGAGQILLNNKDEFIEKFVSLLSPRFYQFVVENNELFKWLSV